MAVEKPTRVQVATNRRARYDYEIEDELELQDGGARAYQEVLVRRQGDASWTHINWQLIKHNGAWMTESVVTY